MTIFVDFEELDYNPFLYNYDNYGNDLRPDIDCFGNKLVFTDGTTTVSPEHPGFCSSYSDTSIVLRLDTRDLYVFVLAGFVVSMPIFPTVMVYTNDKAHEGNFPLQSIAANAPINFTYVETYQEPLYISEISFDTEDGILLLHFTAFVRVSTFNLTDLRLATTSYDLNVNNSHYLTGGDILSVSETDDLAIDFAIQLLDSDRLELQRKGICVDYNDCNFHWPESFVESFSGVHIEAGNYYLDRVYRESKVSCCVCCSNIQT